MSASTAQIIPLFTKNLQSETVQLCNARDLHANLQVGTLFAAWIRGRIEKYGFTENEDYFFDFPVLENQTGRGGDRRTKDYHITLDMAKELAMIENNDKGRAIRKYFIAVEKEARKAFQGGNPSYRPESTREVHTGGLTLEQQDAVKALHKTLVEAVPQDQRGKMAVKLWASVKKKFGVSYKDVPPADFTAILSLMSRVAVEGEYLPKPEPVNALHQLPNADDILKQAVAQHLGQLRVLMSMDENLVTHMTVVGTNSMVFTPEELPNLIGCGGRMPLDLMPRIIQAAAKRLQK